MALDITSYILGKAAGGGGGDPHEAEYTAAAYDVCEQKGATMPAEETLANLANCIDTIPSATIIPPEAGTLTGILLGSMPTKTTYTEGEALDLTGCVILGEYSNGYEYDVTQRCTFTCNDPVTYYDTKIVVTLDTFSLDIAITVNGLPVQAPAETVGLWHFDDHTDKNEVNGKGTSPSGLVNPQSVSVSAGKFNDGTSGASVVYYNYNNCLQLSNAESSQINNAEFTFELWFYSGAYGTNKSTLSVHFASGNNTSSSIKFTIDGTGAMDFSGTSTSLMPNMVTTSTTIDLTKWHHFAFVINKTDRKVYIDGNLAVSSSGNITSTNGALKFIDDNVVTRIYIDEVLMTESVKYSSDFEPPHGPYYLANGGE